MHKHNKETPVLIKMFEYKVPIRRQGGRKTETILLNFKDIDFGYRTVNFRAVVFNCYLS